MKVQSIGIYGESDDLATIEADGEAYDEQGSSEHYVFTAKSKSLHVHISFGRGGWSIATRIEDASESGGLPFDVQIVQHHHSPKLVVTPRTCPVTFLYFETGENDERITKTVTIEAERREGPFSRMNKKGQLVAIKCMKCGAKMRGLCLVPICKPCGGADEISIPRTANATKEER